MKKQTKMISLVVCLMTLVGVSTASAQTLVLHHANGTTTDVELFTMRAAGDKVCQRYYSYGAVAPLYCFCRWTDNNVFKQHTNKHDAKSW